MTLARGTDWLESARLMLRRIALDDLEFFTRIHALPEVTRHLYPGGRPRSPEETALWLHSTLEGYEQLDASKNRLILRTNRLIPARGCGGIGNGRASGIF